MSLKLVRGVYLHVKEAPTPLVLLIGLAGLLNDPGIQKGDHFAVGGADDCRCSINPELRCGHSHTFAELMDARCPLGCRVQLRHDSPCVVGFAGQVERSRSPWRW